MNHMPIRILCAVLVSVVTLSAFAIESSQTARYLRERARCNAVHEPQARANCLSEASTAAAQTLPPDTDADRRRYARNALERCTPLPPDDRADCIARMNGIGTVSGSVAQGGIYRELRTREAPPSR